MTTGPPLLVTERQFESWVGVATLTSDIGLRGWTVAGGQMVAVHLNFARLPFPRVTIDADVVIDVRSVPNACEIAARALIKSGWMPSGADFTVHRFNSPDGGVLDILGPDGLRKRPTTIPPNTTLLAPGGTQLLRRSEPVTLTIISPTRSLDELVFPLPTRLGALIGKSAALSLPTGRDRHLLDAIHLAAALVPNDFLEKLSASDRRWLRDLIQRATGDQRIWLDIDPVVLRLALDSLNRLALIAPSK